MKGTKEAQVGRRVGAGVTQRLIPPAAHAVAGFLLAQGRVFGSATPFGVAFAAAFGSRGTNGLAGGIGAALGALMAWRLGDGLKYLAACVLALVAVKAFAGTTLSKGKFFSAAVAAGSLATVGFVFIASESFPVAATASYIAEVALAALSALVLPYAVSEPRGEMSTREKNLRAASKLIAAALVLLSLSSVPIVAGVTVGRTAAAMLVLAAAGGGGMGVGAAAGVAFGLVFDADGGGGFYTLTFGAAGLVSGVMSGGPRLLTAAAFSLTAAACALLDGSHFSALYETFIAATAFVMIPDGRLRFFDFLLPEESGSTAAAERRRFRERAQALGDVLSDAANALRASKPSGLTRDKVYLRASARVCKGCALRAICWERERDATMENMNAALDRVREKGSAETDDLPQSFRARCMRAENFADALDEEYRVYQLERRRQGDADRRRTLAAARYASASGMMSEASQELSAGLEWLGREQVTARRALNSAGVAAEVTAWRYPGGRRCVEVAAERVGAEALRALEQAMDCEFAEPRSSGEGSVLLLEKGTANVRIGAATIRRSGSMMNGDSGTYFETEDGSFYVILSDGMGSGEAAAAESTRAVRLAEKLLNAGVSPTRVIEQVAALSVERGSESFATLDILALDGMNGRGSVTKLGAAASFVLSNGKTAMIPSDGGSPLELSPKPRTTSLRAGSFDCILLATDGVSAEPNDRWVEELLKQVDTENDDPAAFARKVAESASRRTAGADDVTVVAVFLG